MAKPITPQEMTAYVEATWNKCQEEAWQEQEPVAWMHEKAGGYRYYSWQQQYPDDTPLYTAPPKKEWVGLTDEEKYDVLDGATGDGGRVYYDTLFRSYEAKLKEKNT